MGLIVPLSLWYKKHFEVKAVSVRYCVKQVNHKQQAFIVSHSLRVGGGLVGLGWTWLLMALSMQPSPPAQTSPGMFFRWQCQRASECTQGFSKPKFSTRTPHFLLIPLFKTNHMAELEVKKRGVPSPAWRTPQGYLEVGRGWGIGATDAVYQRPVNQAIIFRPTAACWFLFLYLPLTCGLALFQVLTTMESEASLGGSWHCRLLSLQCLPLLPLPCAAVSSREGTGSSNSCIIK